jgi:tetratricopeptide (TPR) repeat protein
MKNRFTYARSLIALKDYKTAAEQLYIALEDTLESGLYILLGNCYIGQDIIDSACKYYDLGLDISPNPMSQLSHIAQTLYDRNYARVALKYCHKILVINPQDTYTHIMAGQIHQRLGNPDSALHYFNTALQQEPSSYSAAISMANYHYQQGDLSQSLEILREAEKHNPDNPDILLKIGYMLKLMSRGDEAIEAFRKILRINPELIQARHFMAEVYFDMNQPEIALTHWDSALAVNSSFVPGYFGQARAYDRLGNAEMAKKSLEICLRLNPQIDLDPDANELLKKYNLVD